MFLYRTKTFFNIQLEIAIVQIFYYSVEIRNKNREMNFLKKMVIQIVIRTRWY